MALEGVWGGWWLPTPTADFLIASNTTYVGLLSETILNPVGNIGDLSVKWSEASLTTFENFYTTLNKATIDGCLMVKEELMRGDLRYFDNLDLDTTWFAERFRAYNVFCTEEGHTKTAYGFSQPSWTSWMNEAYYVLVKGFTDYMHGFNVDVGHTISGLYSIDQWKDEPTNHGVDFYVGPAALAYAKANFEFIVLYTNSASYDVWNDYYFQWIDDTWGVQRKIFIPSWRWGPSTPSGWTQTVFDKEITRAIARNMDLTVSVSHYDEDAAWSAVKNALEVPSTRDEIYIFLDALAATYSGTRASPYLESWGFPTASKRQVFWVLAWQEYTDAIGQTNWYEDLTYYITFPKLRLAWNPDYQDPPIEPPPEEEPPEEPPVEEPPVEPPPETDPPPNPPPSSDPVEPPVVIPPPPIPGLDLPTNPDITFAEGDSRLLSKILGSLGKTAPVSIDKIFGVLEKGRVWTIEEIFRVLEKQGVIG